MDAKAYLWWLAAPLFIPCLILGFFFDLLETPRHVRDMECRTAIIEACDRNDVEEVNRLLRKWERIRPDIHSARTAQVTLSITTMSDSSKLAHVRRIVEEAIKVEEPR